MNTNRIKYHVFANIVFLFHILVVFIILFGWYFSSLRLIYVCVLFATLLSEILLGYCPLTKLEFDFRKKLIPNLNYDYSFLSYYVYQLTNINVPGKYVRYPAIIFLTASLFFTLQQII